MDKELLKKTFREYKKVAKVDFAITKYCDKWGENTHGIVANHEGEDISKLDRVFISHDITEEQAKTFYEVFGKDFNITPSAYDPLYSFVLYDKSDDVYEISFPSNGDGQLITEPPYVSAKRMKERMDDLLRMGHDEIHIKRIFKGI